MRESRIRFLGREDPLKKELAIHTSTLAWKIPWTEEPDRLQSMEWLHFHFLSLGYTHKIIGSKDLNRYLYTHVHGNVIWIAKMWKQPKVALMDEWINKMWYICTTYKCDIYIHTHTCTMEYYLALKRWNSDTCLNMNESWRHYTKWKKPVPERTNTVGFFWTSYELPGTVKSIETRSKIEATRGCRDRNVELFNGDRVSGWDDGKVLEMVIITQQCECI